MLKDRKADTGYPITFICTTFIQRTLKFSIYKSVVRRKRCNVESCKVEDVEKLES